MIQIRTRARAFAYKSRSTYLLLFIACLSNTLLTGVTSATTAAGRTKGSFLVSDAGAATHTIPIWAPPGPNGMQPGIALAYSNLSGSGYVGIGWYVSGLSSIYRCNLTYAQDASPAAVALVTGDGYCIDGQRLRLTSGTYGEAGSTYQTEIANFVNVTAYGAAGNGPAYFTAQARNGVTYTYGNGGNSQVLASGSTTAHTWQLNEASDPAGNTMAVAYTTATGSSVPSTISWTPTSYGANSYSYTMTFSYGANAPQSSTYGYVAGTAVTNTKLLSSISIAYSGTAVKTYYLTYQASPTTARDQLIEVQECAGSGISNCLLPTTITYQSGAPGVSTTAKTALSVGTSYAHYDFNGDGYQDLLYCNTTACYVSFGSASGYQTPVSTGIPGSAAQVLPGHFLSNGQDALIAAVGGTWYYYVWNGSSFAQTSTGFSYDSTAQQYQVADVNGDGLADLVATYLSSVTNSGNTTYTYDVYIHLNTGGGTTVSFGSAFLGYQYVSGLLAAIPVLASNTDNAGGLSQAFGSLRHFDFNGDGRDDLSLQLITESVACKEGTQVVPSDSPSLPTAAQLRAIVAQTGAGTAQPQTTCVYTIHTNELLAGGSTASPSYTAYNIYSATGDDFGPIAFINFNSDACTDYVVANTVYSAGCNGSTPSSLTFSGVIIGAMDWNGDGLTDLLVANGSTVGVYLSTGDALSTLVTTSIPYSSANTYFTLDANGDGLDDLGYWTPSGTYYYLHNGAGTPPDLLASVTDGFGNFARPTYVSLVQNNYTKNGYGSPPAGYEAVIGPQYVVNEAVFSDPSSSSGGTFNQTYWYYGAWTNLQGRGWQSFYGMRAIDSRNSVITFRYYERTFPYTGMEFNDTTSNSVQTFSGTVRTLAPLVTLSSTQYQERYFAYFNNVTTEMYEVGGSENGDLITTSSTNYTLDNYGNPTTIATTVTDNDPGSPYKTETWTTTLTNTPDESTSPWCLNLLSQSQIAHTASNGSTSVTKTRTFTPDLAHCRYTQVVTQPGTSYSVTKTLAHDSFGNISGVTVTGYDMPGRVTTTNWGTTGQFLMSVTDPANAITQYNYNFSYGVPSSVTDPNGETTTQQYTDGFGRKNLETRPDGTYTAWTYQNCSGTSGCLVGSNGLVIGHTVYNTNASVQSSGTTYLDSVGRTLVSNQTLLSGYTRTEFRYDSMGRLSQKAFPCTWSSLTTSCTYWTTNSYDVLNRLTKSQRPISSTNSSLQTTTYAYSGRSKTVTDPLSNARTFLKDVNDWLRQTTDPYAYAITLAYDAAGNQTKVTDSLGNTLWSGTYNYGTSALPKTTSDMDMGTWSYTYDALGERTAWTDPKGQSFGQSYDAISRPLSRSEPDLFTQWTYGSSASSHNIGKLQSVCTGLGPDPVNCTSLPGYAESETYDTLARPATRAITTPDHGTFTYTRTYNATTGLLNTLTYPVSTSGYALELQYGYSNGVLQTVTDVSDTPNITLWQADAMNPAGQITQETLGNGIVTTRSYDAVTGWLGSAQSGVGGGSAVKNLSFLFDEMGDVTQRQDNNLGLTENIYYDNDYRLSYSQLNGTQNFSVTYDVMGDITSRSDSANGATWTYDPVHKHQVTVRGDTNHEYSYDANGNALTRPSGTLTWSSYNYPISVTVNAETTGFAYGPDRQRWQQTYVDSGVTEVTDYIGNALELISSGGTTTYRHYAYVNGTAVAIYSRNNSGLNAWNYVLEDHQSSVSSLVNSSGVQTVGESFDAFGNRRNPTTWSGAPSNADLTTIAGITREGYTFQTVLGQQMGLNHLNGRIEDAQAGRFLSADPTVPHRGNTQSYNRYSYVNNNPITLSDPSGFTPCGWKCKPIISSMGANCGRACANHGGFFDPGSLTPQRLQSVFVGSPEGMTGNSWDGSSFDTGDSTQASGFSTGYTTAMGDSSPGGDDDDGSTDLQPVQVTAQYKNPDTGELLAPGSSSPNSSASVGVLAAAGGAATDLGGLLASALSGASGVLMLAPTATATANEDEAQIPIYRVVGPAELVQIQSTQQYGPSPSGFGEKQFWTTPESAQSYANSVATAGWDNPATVVQSYVGPETFSTGTPMVLDGRQAISFPGPSLPAVNADAARNGGIRVVGTYTGGQ